MNIPNRHPADALFALRAQVADLEKLVKVEHARLVAMGEGAHEGEIARATVTIADRDSVDWKGIAQALKPSLKLPRENWSPQIADLVDVNTSTKPVTTVRTNARTG